MGSHGARRSKVTVGGKQAALWNGERRPQRSQVLREVVTEHMWPEILRVPERGARSGRKDTKRWCKGKPGREHRAVLVKRPWFGHGCSGLGWWLWDGTQSGRWGCCHVMECENCGKILKNLRDEECPDYQPKSEWKTW